MQSASYIIIAVPYIAHVFILLYAHVCELVR